MRRSFAISASCSRGGGGDDRSARPPAARAVRPEARWDWVGKVKSWVSVLSWATGNLQRRGCQKLHRRFGCDGLMIGRGAAVRPWLFSELARELYLQPSRRHSNRAAPRCTEDSASCWRRVSRPTGGSPSEGIHALFQPDVCFGHNLAAAVQASRSVEAALERADSFFERNELQ